MKDILQYGVYSDYFYISFTLMSHMNKEYEDDTVPSLQLFKL